MPMSSASSNADLMRKKIAKALSWMPKQYISPDAIELLLATAAVESRLGKYNYTPGSGGVGVFQVNPQTEQHLWDSYIKRRPLLEKAIRKSTGVAGPNPAALSSNFPYAAAMARLAYTRAMDPIPSGSDPTALASYWKKWYNTSAGKGTEQGFVDVYNELVKGRKLYD